MNLLFQHWTAVEQHFIKTNLWLICEADFVKMLSNTSFLSGSWTSNNLLNMQCNFGYKAHTPTHSHTHTVKKKVRRWLETFIAPMRHQCKHRCSQPCCGILVTASQSSALNGMEPRQISLIEPAPPFFSTSPNMYVAAVIKVILKALQCLQALITINGVAFWPAFPGSGWHICSFAHILAASLIFNHSSARFGWITPRRMEKTHISRHAYDLCSSSTVTFVQGVKHQSSGDVLILDCIFKFRPADTYYMQRHVHTEGIFRYETKIADHRPWGPWDSHNWVTCQRLDCLHSWWSRQTNQERREEYRLLMKISRQGAADILKAEADRQDE